MSHSTHSTQSPYQSRYPELKIPEDGFKSTIPAHLLEGCNPQMQWLLQEVSKNTQATEFACKAVVEQNNHLRALNGKTYRNEKDIADTRVELGLLSQQTAGFAPLIKPVKMFASLWEYRVFRWTIYAGLFFILTYLYPYYVTHPFDLGSVVSHFLAG